MDKSNSKEKVMAANYSNIVAAEDYNRMMTNEHLYIAQADRIIGKIVRRYTEHSQNRSEVLEIGCGPARLTPLLTKIPNVNVTAVDYDSGWIKAAKQAMETEGFNATLVCADMQSYRHPQPINVAVSQGTHHHIKKGESTSLYLENLRRQLARGGIYIISDEMVAYYENEEERYVRLCIWYAHIITAALRRGYERLAVAEMETLLDDLFEGSGKRAIKDTEQMRLVRSSLEEIVLFAGRRKLKVAEQKSEVLLRGIRETQSRRKVSKNTPLSRGDYKVCFSILMEEITEAGFKIREAQTIGPIETIGGFGIYTLEPA